MSITHSRLAELCYAAYQIDEANTGKDFAFCAENGDTLIVILKGSTFGEEGFLSNRQWYENVQIVAPDVYNGVASVLNFFGYKVPVLTGESYSEVKERSNASNKASAKELTELIVSRVVSSTKKILLTGHSRGGMLAVQCGLEVHSKLPALEVSVVTFAAPIMTMTPDEISYLSDKVTCYVHYKDPVVALDAGGGSTLAKFKTTYIHNEPQSTDGATDWFAAHRIEVYIGGVTTVEMFASLKTKIDNGTLLFDMFQRC